MSKLTSAIVLGVLCGLLASTAFVSYLQNRSSATRNADGSTVVLHLAHGLDMTHPVHAAMQEMADLVWTRSHGTLQIQLYPNGQLGNESECVEQVQRGALEMAKISAAPLESFVPEMAIFGVPYLFRDEDHFWQILNDNVGHTLLLAGEIAGLRGLCYYDAGSRSFYTADQPILVPEDLENMKIRVMKSRTSMEMISTLGGAPTPLPWGELYTALQQGVVDGAENNLPSYVSSRHFEVCKELSLSEHTRIPDVLLIGCSAWDSLSTEHQTLLQEAAYASSKTERLLWQQRSSEALETALQAGVHLHRPAKDTFAARVQPMHERFAATPFSKIFHEIKAVR